MSYPSMPTSNKSPKLQPQIQLQQHPPQQHHHQQQPPHQQHQTPLPPQHIQPTLIPVHSPLLVPQGPTTNQIIRNKLLNKGGPTSPVLYSQTQMSPTLVPTYYQQPHMAPIPPNLNLNPQGQVKTPQYQLVGYDSYRRPDASYPQIPYQPEIYPPYPYPNVYYQYPVYPNWSPRMYPEHVPIQNPSFRDITDSPASFTDIKLKPSNFSATKLIIGEWEVSGTFQADIVAKFYFTKKQIVWELLKVSVKSKIVICFADVSALVVENLSDDLTSLTVEISKRPKFYKEINPQPKKNTMWGSTEDFSPNSQASVFRRHTLHFKKASLTKNLEKLQQSDQKLRQLLLLNQFTTDDVYLPGENPSSPDYYLNQEKSKTTTPNTFSPKVVSENSANPRAAPQSPSSSSPYSNPSSDLGCTSNNPTGAIGFSDETSQDTKPISNPGYPGYYGVGSSIYSPSYINTQVNPIGQSSMSPPSAQTHPVNMVQVSQQTPSNSNSTTPLSGTPIATSSSDIEKPKCNINLNPVSTTTTTTTTTTATDSLISMVDQYNHLLPHTMDQNQNISSQPLSTTMVNTNNFYNFPTQPALINQVPIFNYHPSIANLSNSSLTTHQQYDQTQLNSFNQHPIDPKYQLPVDQLSFGQPTFPNQQAYNPHSLLPLSVTSFINQPNESIPKANAISLSGNRHHPYSPNPGVSDNDKLNQ